MLFPSFVPSFTVKKSEAQRGCDFLKEIETEAPELKFAASLSRLFLYHLSLTQTL